jgi:isopentenyl diphosphate isomerase/L-lactate dehydrogenase-like FMN-dependent dehydrogenase
VKRAVKAGCKVVCITVSAPYWPAGGAVNGNPRVSWAAVDRVCQEANVPVVLKSIMRAEEAKAAVDRGIQGIIVSNNGGLLAPGLASPVEWRQVTYYFAC